MANKKEVKQHIGSVSDIRTITNAMYLIASTKLRRAKEEIKNARPCFTALEKTMKILTSADGAKESKYFCERAEGKTGIVVITADKGLAGAYNYNVLRKAASLIKTASQIKIYPIGGYGKQYYTKHKTEQEEDFVFSPEGNTLLSARAIADILLEDYDSGELKELYIVYTDFAGGMSSEVVAKKLLPLTAGEQTDRETKYHPSALEVIDGFMPEYLTEFLFGAIKDSFCSEQNARMTAMDAAGRNAEKLLEELSVKYDHIRQNTITQEIIEVSAGVGRQRQKGE